MADQDEIYIGTSGWSYPKGEGTWKGHFYPRGEKDELSYYSRYFRTVEINSSFYRPPNPVYVANWLRKTPSDFIFSAKLWQKFTHPGMFKEATGSDAIISSADIKLFKESIEPLQKSGRLGALLAQFPASFRNGEYNRQTLKAVINSFAGYRLAVELRHCSWSDDPETEKLLVQGNAAWVQTDEPAFKSSIARRLPLTSDIAYFRFHGRNAENWWSGDNETRYKYLYTDAEIEELAQEVAAAARQAKLTFALFNNHWQGYAPRNAIGMIKSLQQPVKELLLPQEHIPKDAG